MHMAVLAGNYNCVLMLINEGASIPASDPFRLTPLLLAKLKLDNLKQTHHSIHIGTEEWTSETAKSEYDDLKAITQVLVNHLAKKHINTYGVPSYDKTGYYGLSDFLFSHEDELTELNDVILDITDRLSIIDVNDSSFEETENNNRFIRDSINGLIEKVKELGINEVNHV
ncbi:hypothetical protein BDB01DRAFT_795667 [Pilobolus umbonatus]|nr:hypothetical protein BDB01DRAFT_795667 [Pilobolus umbonatus]